MHKPIPAKVRESSPTHLRATSTIRRGVDRFSCILFRLYRLNQIACFVSLWLDSWAITWSLFGDETFSVANSDSAWSISVECSGFSLSLSRLCAKFQSLKSLKWRPRMTGTSWCRRQASIVVNNKATTKKQNLRCCLIILPLFYMDFTTENTCVCIILK